MTGPDGTKYVQFNGESGPMILTDEQYQKLFNAKSGLADQPKRN